MEKKTCPQNKSTQKVDPPHGNQAKSMEHFAAGCFSSEVTSTKHDRTVSRSRLTLFSQLNSSISLVFPVQRLTILPGGVEVCLHPLVQLWLGAHFGPCGL